MKKIQIRLLLTSLLIGSIFQSCKEEPLPDKPPVNDNELITTVNLILEDSADNTITEVVYRDLDGEGGGGPSLFDSIQILPNRTYTCKVLLLDESKMDTDTISNEVKEEQNDHLFIYKVIGGMLSIQIIDKDDKGLDLGLKSVWRTKGASSGKMQISLKHQPGIKTGSPDPGETDLDLEFKYRIQ